ncbi:hypothetical protein ACLOJK_012961 [Asimina triloba]
MSIGGQGPVGPNAPLCDPLLDPIGFGRLSIVAATAAQSAASAVQAGTRELTSKVRDGSYDYQVNETVNVVATKTTEIGQRTWGMVRDVMAMASNKVEEYTKESWERNDGHKDSGKGNKGWCSPTGHSSSLQCDNSATSSCSWDDWDAKDSKHAQGGDTHSKDSWSGWDDDGGDNYHHIQSSKKSSDQSGKSGSSWTAGGFN